MESTTGITKPNILTWHGGSNLHLRISIDARNNYGHPINRDYDLPFFCLDVDLLDNQEQTRQMYMETTEEHFNRLSLSYPADKIVAFVGNGNLLANRGFVALFKGTLYHLGSELIFHQHYTCITSWKEGSITIEHLWFARENGKVVVIRKMGNTLQDISDKIYFATSGQGLIRGGQIVPLEQIAEQWYDTRHLVQLLCLNINGTRLFFPNNQLQQGLLRKAFREPVHIRLETRVDRDVNLPLTTEGWLRMSREKPEGLVRATPFLKKHGIMEKDDNLQQMHVLLSIAEKIRLIFKEALDSANYNVVDNRRLLREGDVRITNGHIKIFFRKSLYPHNIFVRWANDTYGFVVFPGRSGRAGVSLPYAQQFLKEELNVHDAILLDNGGDVRLWLHGRYIIQSSENREYIGSILALMATTRYRVRDVTNILQPVLQKCTHRARIWTPLPHRGHQRCNTFL